MKNSKAKRMGEIMDSLLPDQPKHTQGEWNISDQQNLIVMPDAVYSLKMVYGKHSTETREANAQRIVKAVNMHDELIQTIKDFLGVKPLSKEENNLRQCAYSILKQAELK